MRTRRGLEVVVMWREAKGGEQLINTRQKPLRSLFRRSCGAAVCVLVREQREISIDILIVTWKAGLDGQVGLWRLTLSGG